MTLEVRGERWRESVKQRKPLQWTLLRGHQCGCANHEAMVSELQSHPCIPRVSHPRFLFASWLTGGSADRTRGPEEKEGTSHCVSAARWHRLASCSDGRPPSKQAVVIPGRSSYHQQLSPPTTCRASLRKCSLDPSTRTCPSSGTSKLLSTSCSAGTISSISPRSPKRQGNRSLCRPHCNQGQRSQKGLAVLPT